MSQQHISLGTAPDGKDGDTNRTAWLKAEANFNELYGGAMAVSSFKNLLINGDFRLNVRNFAGGTLAANTYGFDRWRALGASVAINVSSASVSLNGTICQIIEAPNLAGQTVTVSVSNPSGPITVKLQPDATTATSATGTITAGAGTRSVTLAVPATLTGNVYVLLTTAGSISFDAFGKRAGVQLEIGSVATSFDQRPIAAETMLCQRYARIVQGGGLTGVSLNTTTILFTATWPTMRAQPSVTLLKTSFSSGSFELIVGSNWASGSGCALVGPTISPQGMTSQMNGFTGLSTGVPAVLNSALSSIFMLDAEL